jgi:hypothetical protein
MLGSCTAGQHKPAPTLSTGPFFFAAVERELISTQRQQQSQAAHLCVSCVRENPRNQFDTNVKLSTTNSLYFKIAFTYAGARCGVVG